MEKESREYEGSTTESVLRRIKIDGESLTKYTRRHSMTRTKLKEDKSPDSL